MMAKLRQLLGLFIVLISCLTLAGCHSNQEKHLYYALPSNTDGYPSGKIVLVEFLDYANPDCIKMAPILSQVMEKRPHVRIIYHPIVTNPKMAYSTEYVLAASLQDRFLAAHHLLLSMAANKLDPKQTADALAQAFVDPNQIQQQAQGPEVAAMIAANQKLAQQWDVTNVPTFFVGRFNTTPQPLTGPQTLTQLLQAIDAAEKE